MSATVIFKVLIWWHFLNFFGCVAILQQRMYNKVVCALHYYIIKNAIILDHCPLRTALVLSSCSGVIDNQKVAVL